MKRLESVGFTREQAEAQAETFLSIVQEQLVTKQDLKEVEAQLTVQIKELESKTTLEFESIRRDIKELESKTLLECEYVRRDIKELEMKTTQQIKELESKTTQQIKELEINAKNQSELLRRDLKIWFGGMLVGLVVVMSGIMTLIVHLGGH